MVLDQLIRKKPLAVFHKESEDPEAKRKFGFWTLMCIGVGGCVGSGVFVLGGQVAATVAGPATVLSWLVAGGICIATALAYSEFAALLRTSGGAYSFSYFGLGELSAGVALFLLTLEYGFSGAAVARSWGDKVAFWFNHNGWVDCPPNADSCWVNAVGGTTFNPAAMFISTIMASIPFFGLTIEKHVLDWLCVVKMIFVVFVIIASFVYFDSDNLTPFFVDQAAADSQDESISPVDGLNLVIRGAVLTFFGFVGFDEVASMTGDAIRPSRDVPMAMVLSVIIVAVVSALATLGLVGMQPSNKIDQSEGFGAAFEAVGAHWATQITLIGEVSVILPVVVLVSYMPQLRILRSAAIDGQLPKMFSAIDSRGTAIWSVIFSAVLFTLVAAFVPFTNLNDLISSGILLSFIMTNCSLMSTRSEGKANKGIVVMCLLMMAAAFLFSKGGSSSLCVLITCLVLLVAAVGVLIFMTVKYNFKATHDCFKTPFVPFLPALCILLNWYLISQLTWLGIALLAGYIVLAFLTYLFYGFRNTLEYSTNAKVDDLEPGNE